MSKFGQLVEFLTFMLRSTNQHGIHSPYLFDFYNQVISDERKFYAFEKLESIRRSYDNNDNPLEIIDLGAGSSYNNAKTKSISQIAQQQVSGNYQLRVIFRIIEWSQNRANKESLNIVELGSSLGLSTFYLASVSSKNQVNSFEGNPHFVKFIEFQKEQLGYSNVNMIEGNFDETYKDYTNSTGKIDIAFIDGNHREQATKDYFEWSLDSIHSNSILVFDDIHWSKGMKNAWNYIKNHPRVKASIDMYFMGIVFFKDDFQEKRHLNIRPVKLR